MFTKLTVLQRISVGLILAIAFLLVLGSNRLDKRHFSTIQNTVNSVYKDRVVVQNLIYEASTIFHKKELRYSLDKTNPSVHGIENEQLESILAQFRKTELTSKEYNLLLELTASFEEFLSLEKDLSNTAITEPKKIAVLAAINVMEQQLHGLAKIQLEESEQLTELSNKSLDMNVLMSRLELGFMIVIGIAMMALIFYPVKKMVPSTEDQVSKRT
ncbi:hypothetical protein ACFQZJ_16985 [Maribacter chungangensis]|uniref:Chemotaxis methyl-accepting receptor HlyB-like 4HB MCP domain-containing protein n=1 Tax=Maribacter chungangensis TaxID=1069117 RepID=A0ABW3B768_9FLAO